MPGRACPQIAQARIFRGTQAGQTAPIDRYVASDEARNVLWHQMLKPGGKVISIAGSPDPAFAKELGAPTSGAPSHPAAVPSTSQ